MWFTCVSVTILIFSTVTSYSTNLLNHVRHFEGHKVYRVIPTTPEHVKVLQNMATDSAFEFWTGPTYINNKVDIMMPPLKQNQTLDMFRNHELKYSVMIENVESLVQAERDWSQKRDSSVKFDWNSYYSYADIISWADTLKCGNGVKLTSEVYGVSGEGRALKVYKFSLGSSPPRRAMWVDGTFHAREWISTAVVTYFMNDLCNNASNTFLKELDVYIAPIVNPDGYEYSRNVDRMWRKTRKDYNSSRGCVGVDPNRNFDFHFAMAGSSDDKCSEIYHGPYAWSETETFAMKNYLLHNRNAVWTAYITVHSYGQQILIPYSFDNVTLPENYPEMENLAGQSRDAIQSVHGISFSFGRSANVYGLSSGCADDWAYAKGKFVFSYTFELRDTGEYGFLLPPDCIIPAAEETLEGFKYIANYVVKPIR